MTPAPIRLRRCGESGWHADAFLLERLNHLAKRGILPAHRGDFLMRQIFQPADVCITLPHRYSLLFRSSHGLFVFVATLWVRCVGRYRQDHGYPSSQCLRSAAPWHVQMPTRLTCRFDAERLFRHDLDGIEHGAEPVLNVSWNEGASEIGVESRPFYIHCDLDSGNNHGDSMRRHERLDWSTPRSPFCTPAFFRRFRVCGGYSF